MATTSSKRLATAASNGVNPSTRLEELKLRTIAHKNDLYVALIIILVSAASFGLGRLSVVWPEKEPLRIEENAFGAGVGESTELQMPNAKLQTQNNRMETVSALGKYLASKNGRAYHYPWCPSALKIKDENKIWFETKEEAEKAGYSPAGNCPGL